VRTRAIAVALVVALGGILQGCNQPALVAAQASRDHEAAIHADARGDKVAAFNFYKAAAEGGNMNAQMAIGWKYESGEGVARNDTAALGWYLRAAERGHSNASNNIGALINAGRGVPRNPARALSWFLRGAQLGNPRSFENIASFYENGALVARDTAKAYFWSALAVRFGDNMTNPRMQRVGGSMSAEDKKSIDGRVLGYRADHFLQLTRDLRARADPQDFVITTGSDWEPGLVPIKFRFPVQTASMEIPTQGVVQ
jgi:TPR repeat protein